jgi:hypothetical protein
MKTTGKIPKAVIMLGIVSLFTDAASEMIYPLIPVYVAALGSGAVILGMIEGIAETTACSDRILDLFNSEAAYRCRFRCMADSYYPHARQGR